MESFEFVVVGAGLMGASTAWHLAREGREVLVLEARTPANPWGSSHGSARIFRYAYSDPFYVELVKESRRWWTELEQEAGTTLLTTTGALDAGALRFPARLAGILADAGVDHELVGRREARRRWPMLDVDSEVLWHPDGAILDAQTTVETMMAQAQHHGASLLTEWEVGAVDERGSGHVVTARDGRRVFAQNLVLTVGGWLPELLPQLPIPTQSLAMSLEVWQEQAIHLPYTPEYGHADWPSFIHKTPEMQVYSLPGGRDAAFGGQKIAEFCGGRVIPSSSHNDRAVDPRAGQRLVRYAQEHVPGLEPRPYAEVSCVFTMTPTEDFIIQRFGSISVVSPCSGHGGKFAPLIGHIVEQMVTGARSAPQRFSLSPVSRLERSRAAG
ncbi:MAG: FAD-dependent oxidoreductase [Micrococcaceae bacterium]